MNEFETTLAAALHAEAQEATVRTDTAAASHELAARLDAVDRSRTRRRWGLVTAAVAVAAVAVTVVALVSGRTTTDVPPVVGPSPSPSAWSDSAEILGRPQLDVPGWAAAITPLQAPRRLVRWEQDDCTSGCASGKDRKLVLLAPLTVIDAQGVAAGPVTFAGYGESLDRLRTNPAVQMSDWTQQATDGSGVANVATITTSADLPGAMGCEQLDATVGGCRTLVAGTRNVVAVIDAGHAPFVVWLTARSGTDPTAQDSEMAALLSTFRLAGVPISCTGQLGPPESAGCLADLRDRIVHEAVRQAGSGPMNHAAYVAAVDPLLLALQDTPGLPAQSYSVVSPADALSTPTATTPLVTEWTLGTTKETTYVCFAGPAIAVTTTDCR